MHKSPYNVAMNDARISRVQILQSLSHLFGPAQALQIRNGRAMIQENAFKIAARRILKHHGQRLAMVNGSRRDLKLVLPDSTEATSEWYYPKGERGGP